MSTAQIQATPQIRHYVNVFNKTTGERQRLTPQVHPLLASIQSEYDLACELRESRLAKISVRQAKEALIKLWH